MDGVIVTPHQDKPELPTAKSFYTSAGSLLRPVASLLRMRSSTEMTGKPQPVASVEDHPVFERVGKRDAVDSSQQVNYSCRRISSWIIAWLHEILSGDAERRANPKSSRALTSRKILVDSA